MILIRTTHVLCIVALVLRIYHIDTGHTGALCPVSRYADRAYLWIPALGTGHTCGSRS
eukprot:COSAG02_NODE_6017_length_3873_cov_5.501007_2_plen_58_part_00